MSGRKRLAARVIPRLRATLARLEPDIVIAHGTRAGWLCGLALPSRRETAAPLLIYTNHGLAFGRHKSAAESWFMQRIERYVTRRADLVTAVGLHLCTTLERFRGGPVFYTPYGIPLPDVDASRFRPGAGRDEAPVHVVMASRLIPSKGPMIYAEAACRVLPRYPAVHFTLVGRGPLEDAVRRKVEGCEAGRFQIVQGRAESIIATAEVFVLPSHSEGLSIALLEAMSYGCAVVASDIPASRDVIDPGVTGLLFRRGDAGELAACLERLSAEQALRATLGHAARDRLARDFSESRMAERWRATLEAARSIGARNGVH